MNTESRRGRPPKPISASETLSPIRVTPEQKELYKKAANKAKLSVSAWIKYLADKEINKNIGHI
jgi:predicted HicB family RNase H-like nuclease